MWEQLCTTVHNCFTVVAHFSLLIFLRTLNIGEKGQKHNLLFKAGGEHLPSGNLGLASMNSILEDLLYNDLSLVEDESIVSSCLNRNGSGILPGRYNTLRLIS